MRHPLEAVFSSECGPSRAVRLGLDQWTLKAVVERRFRQLCRIQPPTSRRQFSVCIQALLRAGHDANSCGSYAPLQYCRISEFLAASFPRNRRFRDFLRLRTFGGCASGVSGYPVGPTPSPSPAVHSNGWTALHEAAWCGNRIIVGKLIAAKAAVDAQTIGG